MCLEGLDDVMRQSPQLDASRVRSSTTDRPLGVELVGGENPSDDRGGREITVVSESCWSHSGGGEER